MRKALLAAVMLASVVIGPAWAQQSGGTTGLAEGQGTSETGGVPGATAAPGTQGGPMPGASGADQTGMAGHEAKQGTAETGGAPGVPAAAGTEGGCAPKQGQQQQAAGSPPC
jgi:hypothetical protein